MATLRAEERIKQFLSSYDVTAERLCAIVGPAISATRLSPALNNIRALDNTQAAAILCTVLQIQNLVQECEPLPLSLRDPEIVRKLLAAKTAGTLKIDVKIERDDWVTRPE